MQKITTNHSLKKKQILLIGIIICAVIGTVIFTYVKSSSDQQDSKQGQVAQATSDPNQETPNLAQNEVLPSSRQEKYPQDLPVDFVSFFANQVEGSEPDKSGCTEKFKFEKTTEKYVRANVQSVHSSDNKQSKACNATYKIIWYKTGTGWQSVSATKQFQCVDVRAVKIPAEFYGNCTDSQETSAGRPKNL